MTYSDDQRHQNHQHQVRQQRSQSRFSRSSYDQGRADTSDYRSYRDGRSSTYDQYRTSNTHRGRAESRDGGGYTDQPLQHQYSRYESGPRYAQAAQRRSAPHVQTPQYSYGRRRRFSGKLKPILGIVAVALVLIIGIVVWTNRSIEIKVNGKATEVRARSTVDEVYESAGVKTTAGDFISVAGKTIEKGEGYRYLVKLAGEELDGTATDKYRAHEGDELTFEDGRDKTEEYETEVVDLIPELEVSGEAWGNITYVSQWGKAGKVEQRRGKTSGETAQGTVIEEAQNCVVSVHQISPDDGKKLICLTFDDGPAPSYTEKYLEILNQYGIKATFFNLGSEVEAYPELSKKIIEQGSEVMSHTYQHQQLSTLDATSLQSEFSNAFTDIKDAIGVSTTCFRPPYGDFTNDCWVNSGGLASVSVLWNLDSEDWRRAGVDSIVEKSTAGAFSGAIILMHDGGGNRDMDVEALPRIIEKLQAEGYEFVTVTDLMKSDSSIPEDIASGNATMPEDGVWASSLSGAEDSES